MIMMPAHDYNLQMFLQPAATNQGLCNVYVFLFFDNLDGFCVTAHDLARHIFLYEARATISTMSAASGRQMRSVQTHTRATTAC